MHYTNVPNQDLPFQPKQFPDRYLSAKNNVLPAPISIYSSKK